MAVWEFFRDIGRWHAVAYIAQVVAISFLCFFILRMLRGTRGFALVGSFLSLAFLYFIAGTMRLLGITTLFEIMSQGLVIAVVVLFQDDIRRAILKFNPGTMLERVFGTVDVKANEQMIRVVVDCAAMLSANRVGALIVIDRYNDLEDYTASAVQLDAKLTKELLYAAFVPTHENPLHDGATVVTSLRVVAAGCFLPLTTRSDIPQSLGTRHRAAIGLSEVSSALIVVVSEETGMITLCEYGRFDRYTAIDQVRGELQKRLSARGKLAGAVDTLTQGGVVP